MRAGRKRKAGPREKNGDLQRASRADRNATAVALAQPHRRGNTDQLCESPLGRYVANHRLGRACYDAALDFAGLVRHFYRLKGIPLPCGDGYRGSTSGLPPNPETARRITARLIRIERELAAVSRPGLDAVKQLCVYEFETAEPAGCLVLIELARLDARCASRSRKIH